MSLNLTNVKDTKEESVLLESLQIIVIVDLVVVCPWSVDFLC